MSPSGNLKPQAAKSDSARPLLGDAGARRRFRARLLAWYEQHERDLPWRRTRDPYAVWVSEVMLQQTQVPTVVAYFERFLRVFPTVAALAAATEEQVLRLWEGLGYYRRARQMHRAAKRIVAEHGGRFPRDPDVLARLPGIGRYTAGAIASIAMGLRAPIVEANTRRLYSRLLALAQRGEADGTAVPLAAVAPRPAVRRRSPASQSSRASCRGSPPSRRATGEQALWQFAAAILPRRAPGRFNQALMDLGREVCKPREPQCPRCPVSIFCAARARGLERRLPRAARRPKIEHVHEAAVVVRAGNKVLLVRRSDGGRWAGLWDFVRLPVASRPLAAVAPSRPANQRSVRDRKAPSGGAGRSQRSHRREQSDDSPERRSGSASLPAIPHSAFRDPPATASRSRIDSLFAGRGAAGRRRLEEQVRELIGFPVRLAGHVARMQHGVTRFRITLDCYWAEIASPGSAKRTPMRRGCAWVPLSRLARLPMPVTARRLARLVAARAKEVEG